MPFAHSLSGSEKCLLNYTHCLSAQFEWVFLCYFTGCIFDLEFRTRRDGKFIALGKPEGHPNSGRSVGQCGVTPCTLVTCRNGGTCVDSGSSVYCQCPFGWKGALCSETVSVCDAEHRPPPLCARGSTCVPLPDGYTCLCPLGTGGLHCQQGQNTDQTLTKYY
eukprot:XP_014024396.1 PREDICTED: protein eyes shut homolog [Salmo salar]